MPSVLNTDKSDIFFIGDIHGQFKSIPRWIELNCLSNCVIIFCGDFGFGFNNIAYEQQELTKSDNICNALDIDCYIIRGNHDDPSYFTSEKLSLLHFKPLSDYTVIHTPKHNILCVGGAVSVDRIHRKEFYEERLHKTMLQQKCSISEAIEMSRKVWWEDEGFVYDGVELNNITESGIKIDVVATHSAPDFCYPLNKDIPKSFLDADETLFDDCTNERLDITRLYEYLTDKGHKITHWFYGHFHQHHSDIINDTKFYALDMGRASFRSHEAGGNFDMVELYSTEKQTA